MLTDVTDHILQTAHSSWMEEDVQSLLVGLGQVVGGPPAGLGEDQGVCVVPSVVPADIQQGEDFPLEFQPEAVDEAQLVRTVRVVEGQSPALVIQKQAHPVGGGRQRQDHPG